VFDAGKAPEVVNGRVDSAPVLDGERGEVGVGYEVAGPAWWHAEKPGRPDSVCSTAGPEARAAQVILIDANLLIYATEAETTRQSRIGNPI
jgi:hypothetical protein